MKNVDFSLPLAYRHLPRNQKKNVSKLTEIVSELTKAVSEHTKAVSELIRGRFQTLPFCSLLCSSTAKGLPELVF